VTVLETGAAASSHQVQYLPTETLLFLLDSRYCETDRLSDEAWRLFRHTPLGWPRVQAICDFVHNHITLGYEHSRATRTASEAYIERHGVCRDYAHLAVAFCRSLNIPADLVDQLFNSSEKRLARLLLLLANFGKEARPEPIIAKISQETLAEMIGTTLSRVSFFMNKFRRLGFVDYNGGGLEVHSSLLNVVLHD
jgi:Transglutaminase-like superfamily/Crp-like helix-turn-helix domain